MKKSFFSDYLKQLPTIIITIIITSTISVTAASYMVDASKIAYESEHAMSVKTALDTLYNGVEVSPVLPVGSIIPFMGTTAPEGYLLCNGSTYNINDYKKLADHINKDFGKYNFFGGNGSTTFSVPDLRGEFLRGAGTASRNTGSGASVGVHQEPTIIQNWFSTGTSGNIEIWNDSSSYSVQYEDKRISDSTVWQMLSATRRTNLDSRPNKSTTRPTNTSVNYIIKAR